MSTPVDTAAFTASRIANNNIGRHYDDEREIVFTPDGIIALCEGLTGSSVTSLECAALKCSPFCQRPLTLLTIPAPPSVHSLENNWLGPEGGAALAERLKGNSMLQVLK